MLVLITGAHRGKMIAKMQAEPSNMILVASYETVVADFRFRKKLAIEEETGVVKHRHATTKKTLKDLEFYRIVLDEAHRIRTDSSHSFEAVTALAADFKHCLTGSPFVNKPGKFERMRLSEVFRRGVSGWTSHCRSFVSR